MHSSAAASTCCYCLVQAGEDGEQENTAAPSARKRRRLRLSPQHAVDPAVQTQAPEVPPGLQAVAAAIWGAIQEAQAQLSSVEGQAAGSGSLFLALVRVAAAAGASPSLVLGLCTPLLPAWMDASRSGGSGPEDAQRLLQACEGLLTAIPAALEVAAGGGAHAAVSLAAVQPAQLQRLLEAGWEAVSKWDAPTPTKTRGTALLLSTALAATQAELTEGAELLRQLFSSVHAAALGGAGAPAGGATAENSRQSSGGLQRVFGLLLPPACAVGLARDEAHGGSQPRATQAAARKHSHHHHAATQHPPRQANQLVATLQQLVCSLADGLVGDSSAGGGALAQQAQRAQQAAAGAARGLLTVLQLSHQPTHLVESAVNLALWEGTGMQWMSRWGQGPDGSADCQPVLATAMADWVRPALEQLCTVADDLEPQMQVRRIGREGSCHSLPSMCLPLDACFYRGMSAVCRRCAGPWPPLLARSFYCISSPRPPQLHHTHPLPRPQHAPQPPCWPAYRSCLTRPSLTAYYCRWTSCERWAPSYCTPPQASWSTAGRWLAGRCEPAAPSILLSGQPLHSRRPCLRLHMSFWPCTTRGPTPSTPRTGRRRWRVTSASCCRCALQGIWREWGLAGVTFGRRRLNLLHPFVQTHLWQGSAGSSHQHGRGSRLMCRPRLAGL